jgi:hypothetical protein
VPNHEHINQPGAIGDGVDCTVDADPDSPQVFGAAELLRPDGPWLFCEPFQRVKNSI